MVNLKLWAAWFFFLRVIWPTYDTYSDIGISVYCVYHDMRAWGITMTLPIISNLATSISAYIRMRRRGELLGPGALWSSEGFALPLLIWPQVPNTVAEASTKSLMSCDFSATGQQDWLHDVEERKGVEGEETTV